MKCLIAIPTFNRSALIGRAARAALEQSYENTDVLVVDDGSHDDTHQVLKPFMDNPRFCYMRLGKNVGTARAKNVAIAYGVCDAITFHDSDDVPDPHKVLLQVRCLAQKGVQADPCLNWAQSGVEPGSPLEIALVLTQHWLIGSDGSRRKIGRALSLVDDFFPNLQMNAGPWGDWILVNSGLFRHSVFGQVGGFQNCVEEDRELRNRLLMQGQVVWLLEEPLVTKIECADSLTVAAQTNYQSTQRQGDRDLVWGRAMAWRCGAQAPSIKLDLEGVMIDDISRPELVRMPGQICASAVTSPSQIHSNPSRANPTGAAHPGPSMRAQGAEQPDTEAAT
jgi:glycosyltransferase involved in cell wall biosynthesis